MKIYVCADLHLGHNNIHHLRRQFTTAEAHDNYVMSRWRKVVRGGDIVYILGDVAFNRKGLKKLSKLPGRKHIIAGNHDLSLTTLLRFCSVLQCMKETTIKGKSVIMTHIPINFSEFDRYDFNIHGHVHTHTIDDPRYINVSLEVIDYKPVLLDDLIEARLSR